MKIYQVLKVTKEGQCLAKTYPMLKNAINWARETIAIADVAPDEHQCAQKRKSEDGHSYANIRLVHDGYAINVKIQKIRVYHE